MLSIKNNNKYEYIIKNSKFISLLFKVTIKEEVKDYLNKVKERKGIFNLEESVERIEKIIGEQE